MAEKETKKVEEVSKDLSGSSKTPDLLEVILKVDHNDAGIFYPKGSKLKVDVTTLEWMIRHGVVESKSA